MKNLINDKIKITDKIFRERGPNISRKNFLRLDKNERISHINNNVFKKIISKITSEDLTAYPEIEILYEQLSKINELHKGHFVITPGSDSAIRLCFELFTKKRDTIITLTPTFAMVDIYSKLFGVKQIKIGYDSNLNLNIKKLLASISKKVSLIIIANPNSPTGTLIDEKDIIKILKLSHKTNTAVLIDEAYHGFCHYSSIRNIKKFTNLIISRTFSKSFGLAGLRAGYLITNPFLAKQLFSLKPMYEINSLAILIIREFIKNNIDKKYIKEANYGKKILIDLFKKLKFKYFDTFANFVHVDFLSNKSEIVNQMSKNKILFKGGPGVKNLENYIRITTGPKKELDKLIKIIQKVAI